MTAAAPSHLLLDLDDTLYLDERVPARVRDNIDAYASAQ